MFHAIFFCLLLLSIEVVIGLLDQSGLAWVILEKNGQLRIKTNEKIYEDHLAVAMANFTNDQLNSGWLFLEIQTNDDYDDELQAEAAGLVEGYLTRSYIIEQYKEFYGKDVCKSRPEACGWIKSQFVANRRFVSEMVAAKRHNDPYWHQVGLIYSQMDGINKGYKIKSGELGASDDDNHMDYELGVLMLNFMADFWDLIDQYDTIKNSSGFPPPPPSRPSCSVLIKYLPERENILFAHNSWFEYRSMSYRLLKNYRFNYHKTPESNELIAGHTISMSSYAGVVMSLDDFYLSSSGLAATETTLFVYNKELLRHLSANNVVYEPIRVMVANRLATSGSMWANIFRKHNSGTYNNQWMIVDYNLFNESPKQLKQGVFTVLEQLPNKIVIQDQTHVLTNQSYWPSYNRAFYKEIYELSGAKAKQKEFGDWFSYKNTARAKILARDHNKVQDLDSMMKLMRYNKFQSDPYGVIEGCYPSRSPAGSIANRLDLSDPNQKCVFSDYDWMVGHWGYGCIDAKVASRDSFPKLEFLAVNGPTHDGHKPFEWSSTNLKDIPDFRPIDKFDFKPITTSWVLNGSCVCRRLEMSFIFMVLAILLLSY